VASLQFLLKTITPGVNVSTRLADIWRVYVFTFDQFWFSQAAISTFLIVLLLEWILPLAHPYKWPVYLLLAIVVEIAVPKTTIFSLNTFSGMLPVFFLGCLLHGPVDSRCDQTVPVIALLVLLASLTLHQLVWFHRLTLTGGPLLALRYGESFSFIYLLFRFRWTTPKLVMLGGFAYTIYLFHVFGTAGSRILVSRLGVHDRLVLLFAGTLFGLALPMAVDLVFRRSLILRRIFLGRR
jgi:hypothetical protein